MESDSKLDKLIDELAYPKKNIMKRCFKIAKEARNASDWKGQHLGSVIVYKNKILSIGWNTSKETPLQKKFNKYRTFDEKVYKNSEHAEMRAIRTLLHDYDEKDLDFSKISIYIYRDRKDGSLGLAKPCPACEMAIRSLGIKNVFYTGENSIIHEIYNKKEKE